MNDTLSETELLQASAAGSKDAFDAIVRRYQALVCAVTYSATGCLLYQMGRANDWVSFGVILAFDILIFLVVTRVCIRIRQRH